MLGVIRLADRRDVFRNRLSFVQQWALQTLIVWEMSEQRRRDLQHRQDLVRTAMLLSDPSDDSVPSRVEKLFPELFDPVDEVVIYEPGEEELVDTTGVWKFDQSTTSKDEIADVLATLGQSMKVQFTPQEADEDDGWV